jgi:hypothetical protein
MRMVEDLEDCPADAFRALHRELHARPRGGGQARKGKLGVNPGTDGTGTIVFSRYGRKWGTDGAGTIFFPMCLENWGHFRLSPHYCPRIIFRPTGD